MNWQVEIEARRRRAARPEVIGGTDEVAHQRASGKLTMRERLDAMENGSSFHQIGKLTGAAQHDQAVLKTVGPDSLTWKYFGDARCVFVIGQAFVLQLAHPMIDAAMETQSTYREDPWGRTERSFKYLWPVVYSRPERAIEAGKFLRKWHRGIKGVDKYGKKYDAFDPEAYTWVHITAYDAMVRLAELIDGKPLSEEQLEQLYEEWKAVGLLLGCRQQDMPATRAAYGSYFEYMIKEKLAYTDSVRYWLHKDFITHLKRPSRLMPNWIWQAVLKLATWVFDVILRASLPVVFREKFGIQVTPHEIRIYRGLVKIANALWPRLPLRLQYVPYAHEGVRDARQNRQAFHSASARPGAKSASTSGPPSRDTGASPAGAGRERSGSGSRRPQTRPHGPRMPRHRLHGPATQSR